LTVAAPPRPPRRLEPEALFEEARRHRRQRRLRLVTVVLVLLAAGAGAYAALSDGASHATAGGGRAAAAGKDVAVVLLVDVSGSMRASDVKPTRLGAAVAAMRTFLAGLPTSVEVGIVAFSSSAKVVVNPTRDRGAVLNGLASLSPEAGTALGDGLAAAVRLTVASLQRQGIRHVPGRSLPATIVLESDGAQNRGTVSPRQAAERAKNAGIRVDGVALGTPNGTVQFGFGNYQNRVPVPPDPRSVQLIANATGGESFAAASATRLSAIYRKLGATIGR
jgi:Ca-activated chloride channel family protein